MDYLSFSFYNVFFNVKHYLTFILDFYSHFNLIPSALFHMIRWSQGQLLFQNEVIRSGKSFKNIFKNPGWVLLFTNLVGEDVLFHWT